MRQVLSFDFILKGPDGFREATQELSRRAKELWLVRPIPTALPGWDQGPKKSNEIRTGCIPSFERQQLPAKLS